MSGLPVRCGLAQRGRRGDAHLRSCAGCAVVGAGRRPGLPSSSPTKLNVGQRVARSQHGPVVFGATHFFQNDEMVEDDIRAGRYPLPMRLANRIDVRDVADLCARALLEPSYPAGEHVLGGSVSLSGEECARIWAQALGRDVMYVGDDEAVWLPILQHRSGRSSPTSSTPRASCSVVRWSFPGRPRRPPCCSAGHRVATASTSRNGSLVLRRRHPRRMGSC